MRELPVYFLGNRPFLQHDRNRLARLGQWRDEHIDIVAIADPGGGNVDLVAVDGRAVVQRLGDEREKRRVSGNEIGEPRAHERRAPHVEERLGGDIDVDHPALGVDGEQRLGERVQDLRGVRALMGRMRDHAASLAPSSSKARASSRRAWPMSSQVTSWRRSVSPAPAWLA